MNNPPAFPNDVNPINERVGMTLRDYFAAHALSGLIIRNRESENVIDAAYRIADLMLEAREE